MGVGWRHHSRRVLVLVVATAVALVLADECQGRHGATADKRDLCLVMRPGATPSGLTVGLQPDLVEEDDTEARPGLGQRLKRAAWEMAAGVVGGLIALAGGLLWAQAPT